MDRINRIKRKKRFFRLEAFVFITLLCLRDSVVKIFLCVLCVFAGNFLVAVNEEAGRYRSRFGQIGLL